MRREYGLRGEIMYGTALGLAGALAMLGVQSDAAPSSIAPVPLAYVDCAKTPDQSVSVRFDAGIENDFYIGDVETDATGEPVRWRGEGLRRYPDAQFEIDTVYEGIGSVSVTSEGYGMPVPYSALAEPGSFVATTPYIATDSGPRIYVSQLPHPEISSKAPVLAVFACRPGVAGK